MRGPHHETKIWCHGRRRAFSTENPNKIQNQKKEKKTMTPRRGRSQKRNDERFDGRTPFANRAKKKKKFEGSSLRCCGQAGRRIRGWGPSAGRSPGSEKKICPRGAPRSRIARATSADRRGTCPARAGRNVGRRGGPTSKRTRSISTRKHHNEQPGRTPIYIYIYFIFILFLSPPSVFLRRPWRV